jgi:hypothetical protein
MLLPVLSVVSTKILSKSIPLLIKVIDFDNPSILRSTIWLLTDRQAVMNTTVVRINFFILDNCSCSNEHTKNVQEMYNQLLRLPLPFSLAF